MQCAEIKRLLSNYLEDDLSDQQKAEVEEHLWTCENCATELDALRRMVSELGSLKKVSAPENLLEDIHRRLGIQPKKREFLNRIRLPLEAVGVLVSLVLVVYIVNQAGMLKTGKQIRLTEPKEKKETSVVLREKVIPEAKEDVSVIPQAPETQQKYEGISPYRAGYITDRGITKESPPVSMPEVSKSSLKGGYYSMGLYSKPLAKEAAEQKIILVTKNLTKDMNEVKAIVKELEGEIENEKSKNIYIKIPAKNLSILITRLEGITKVIPNISLLQKGSILVNIEFTELQQ